MSRLAWQTDAGHGWLLVDSSYYPDALEAADEYCYRDGDTIALEEDCAAGRWLAAHPEVNPYSLPVQDFSSTRTGDAPVRSWPRCDSAQVTA